MSCVTINHWRFLMFCFKARVCSKCTLSGEKSHHRNQGEFWVITHHTLITFLHQVTFCLKSNSNSFIKSHYCQIIASGHTIDCHIPSSNPHSLSHSFIKSVSHSVLLVRMGSTVSGKNEILEKSLYFLFKILLNSGAILPPSCSDEADRSW